MIVRIAGSSPPDAMDVRLLCLLSIAPVVSHCDRLITLSEESYRMCVCVCVCV